MVSLAMDKVRSDGVVEGADTQNEDAQALAAWLAAQRTEIVAAWAVLARQRSPSLAHCLPAEAVRASIRGGLAEIETALRAQRAPRRGSPKDSPVPALPYTAIWKPSAAHACNRAWRPTPSSKPCS